MNALLKSHWIRRLEIIFLILGWTSLIMTVFGLVMAMKSVIAPQSVFDLDLTKHQNFVFQIKTLLVGISKSFFAFLMSSALSMIRMQKPFNNQKIDLLLRITCIGFIGEGLLGIFAGFQLMSFYKLEEYTVWLIELLRLTPALMSCLYGVTLFILYHHFFKLISFKSEVI
jgi:hypothetical protein